MPTWASRELGLLVATLYTEKNFKVERSDLLAALILAAKALPLDVIEALLPAYVARERLELEHDQQRAPNYKTHADKT